MVNAVNGLVVEQKHILVAFIISIIFFAFQAVGMYWVMMESTSAIVSTCVTFVAMFFWYDYALKLFNRFRWDYKNSDWNDFTNPDQELDDLNPNSVVLSKDSSDDVSTNKKKNKFRFLHLKNRSSKPEDESDVPLYGVSKFIDESRKNEPSGGYLTMKAHRNYLMKEPWERRFFVIKGTLIYYYKDKRSFQLNPSNPINRRPIDLEGYTFVAGNMEPPYVITLVPIDPDDIRKTWKFRCDTLGEFNSWVQTFTEAFKLCDNSDAKSEIVKISSSGLSESGSQFGGSRRAPGNASVAGQSMPRDEDSD